MSALSVTNEFTHPSAVKPDATDLTSKQKKAILTPYTESNTARLVTYILHNPYIAGKACCNTIAGKSIKRAIDDVLTIGGGAVVGACVAEGIGQVVGAKVAIAAGGGVGAAIGAAVVTAETVYDTSLRIQNSKHYWKWANQRAMMLTDRAFRDLIDNDEILRFFKCPLSNQVPEIPVLTPQKHSFDRNALLDWKARNPGMQYQGMDTDCAIADLRFDFALCNTLVARFRKFQAQAEEGTLLGTLSLQVRTVMRLSIFTGFIQMRDLQLPKDLEMLRNVQVIPRQIVSDRIIQQANELLVSKAKEKEKSLVTDANLNLNGEELSQRHLLRENLKVTVIHEDYTILRWVKGWFGIQPKVKRVRILDLENIEL